MINFFRKKRKNLIDKNPPAGRAGKSFKYLKYAVGEIVLVVIGILIALSINNWNEDRTKRNIENKILVEILNGLEQDLLDIEFNVRGHKVGIIANEYFHKIFINKQINKKINFNVLYGALTRDFNSIQNTSGYESLKSRGLELIKNDSLRIEIIKLYEIGYSSIKNLEEEYQESQFYTNYFKEINHQISPNLVFDKQGEIISIQLPLNLADAQKNKMLSYLSRIKNVRNQTLERYSDLQEDIRHLQSNIKISIAKSDKSVVLNPDNSDAVNLLKKLGLDEENRTKEVIVEAATLEGYVGQYGISKEAILTVSFFDGQLKMLITDGIEFPIFPKSQTVFYNGLSSMLFRFNTSEEEEVMSMSLFRVDGKELIFKRLED